MGKHKSKSSKHKKEKKESKRRRSSSSSSNSTEEEWVEKPSQISNDSEDTRSHSRGEWMSLPSSFLTASNLDRRRAREEEKRQEKERQQYNPKENPRELNPYWRDGGDGLPKFQKPSDQSKFHYKRPQPSSSSSSNWRKKSDSNRAEEKKSSIKEPIPSNEQVLSDKELNMLAAKLVKAEIMGNTELIDELKTKLDNARRLKDSHKKQSTEVEDVILTQTDSKGHARPIQQQSNYGETSSSKRKKQKMETHRDGERVRYFADDDRYSLKQMFENEKYNSINDQNSEFVKMATKIRNNDDVDEIFTDKIRNKLDDSRVDARNKDRAIGEHIKITKSLDNCRRCLQSDNMPKNLMITMNDTMYLSLPSHEPLTDNHCLIVPIRHVSCTTQLDENEYNDLMDLRRSITGMFRKQDEDVIFFESAMSLHKYPHMSIECIPLPKEEGDLAPIYFKKAIDESETEWAQNKKLVPLKDNDIRKTIPKGLSYFCVSFGMDSGYAHAIEDEQLFPQNFAQEIIGGMLDLHHSKWRKPKQQSFEEQSRRVLQFTQIWQSFDCTNT